MKAILLRMSLYIQECVTKMFQEIFFSPVPSEDSQDSVLTSRAKLLTKVQSTWSKCTAWKLACSRFASDHVRGHYSHSCGLMTILYVIRGAACSCLPMWRLVAIVVKHVHRSLYLMIAVAVTAWPFTSAGRQQG
jgi:hypothetical protein